MVSPQRIGDDTNLTTDFPS